MQAQRVAPLEMQCKDKFLIQSTIVPAGTVVEDITSSMFAKDSGRYVEENKLKVVFVIPPNTPLASVNGSLKAKLEASTLRDRVQNGVENFPPDMVAKGSETLKLAKDVTLKATKDTEDLQEAKNVDSSPIHDSDELKQAKDVQFKQDRYLEELKLTRDMEELKLCVYYVYRNITPDNTKSRHISLQQAANHISLQQTTKHISPRQYYQQISNSKTTPIQVYRKQEL